MRNGTVRLLGLSGLILGLAGCNYVTTAERTNQLNCLDQDGDGAVADAALCDIEGDVSDCNDSRNGGAMETPGAEEIPYDGWDNDCSRVTGDNDPDLVDRDGDGYPGISQEEWEAITPRSSDLRWPGGLKTTVDCNDDPDAGGAAINPAAFDEPYDGIDSDCQGDEDYDNDGDGFVPDEAFMAAENPNFQPYTGDLPQGDCSDIDEDVYPGAPDEPYDGVDSDCAGDDDYDADGDGHRSSIAVGSGTDCDDFDATIFEGANDPPYDGVDSDCLEDDDHDSDGDGFVPSPDDLPSGAVSYNGPLPDGDCNDADKNIYPGQLEILFDGADQDCDGGEGATLENETAYGVSGPRTPELRMLGGDFLLSYAGDKASNKISNSEQAGVAALFASDSEPGDEPINDTKFKSNVFPLHGDFGVETTNSTVAWAFTFAGGSTTNRLVVTHGEYVSEAFTIKPSVTTITGNNSADEANASGIATRNGRYYATSCSDDESMYLVLDPASGSKLEEGNSGNGCGDQLVTVSGSGDFMHTFNGSNASVRIGSSSMVPETSPRYNLTNVSSMRSHSGLGVIGLAGGGVVIDDGGTSTSYLSSYKILDADAIIDGSLVYIAAVTMDGKVILAEIDGSSEEVAELDWNQADNPLGVTLEMSSTRLMLAVTGGIAGNPTKGSLSWSFYEL